MSKFVVLSDIHGNAPALDAVVEREGFDSAYIVLGDIMGLLAYPKEVLQIIQKMSGHKLAGNHDKALFHYDEGHVNNDVLSEFELSHTMDALDPADKAWMKDRPFIKVLTRSGQRICLCHAYPWPSHASGYEPGNAGVQKQDVVSVASAVSNDYDWVFHGHNHSQFELDCSKFGYNIHFVSCGTLGYNGEYAVVDTDNGNVKLKNVDPQLDKVKKHIKDVLPEDCPSVESWL